MSDRVIAWLRTVVPAAWGSLIVWLVAQAPDLPEYVVAWLESEATVVLITSAAIGLWYIVWRQVEGKIPDWLIRLALGSSQAPSYTAPTVEAYVSDVTGGPVARVTYPDGHEEHFAG